MGRLRQQYETCCWTCQRPIVRQVRTRQEGLHYCSKTCWNTAHALRRRLRFWEHVRQEGECWLWHGSVNQAGYACLSISRSRQVLGHRFIYMLARGPIPVGLVIDHLCRRPACVNPAHLDVVSQRVNVYRGLSPIAAYRHKTHCVHGHAYTPENTGKSRRGRYCRRCMTNRWRLRKGWSTEQVFTTPVRKKRQRKLEARA
jgi:hypothetical protein